ncbi:MAG: DUF433 domain-containing protein [Kofleriaceae bacterium]|nr:DUF433 domain-containing protein [Candidatus Methylomirabilis lanthanidiphila]
MAGGWSFEPIRDNYPGIDDADIRACIAYGAEISRKRYVELPVAPLPWTLRSREPGTTTLEILV